MSKQTKQATESKKDSDDSGDLAKYGITKQSVDQFSFGEYRYSKLSDAVAQAKRSR